MRKEGLPMCGEIGRSGLSNTLAVSSPRRARKDIPHYFPTDTAVVVWATWQVPCKRNSVAV